MSETSKLVNDLRTVPEIVAGLGLGIAEAQKALNLTYLESLRTIAGLLQQLMGREGDAPAADTPAADAPGRTALQQVLQELAPSRYQFTETTLTVRLDLSQTMSGSAQAGLNGVGAVMVSASLAAAFRMDYRGAAELRTVLHALPAGAAVFKELLGRAEQLSARDVELPPRSELDQKIVDVATDLSRRLKGPAPAGGAAG